MWHRYGGGRGGLTVKKLSTGKQKWKGRKGKREVNV